MRATTSDGCISKGLICMKMELLTTRILFGVVSDQSLILYVDTCIWYENQDLKYIPNLPF